MGNQMYQFAFQTLLSLRYPNVNIKADIMHYNLLEEHNGFELNKIFKIDVNIASEKEIKKCYCGIIYNENYKKLPYNFRYWFAHHQWILNRIKRKMHPQIAQKYILCAEYNVYYDKVLNLYEDKDYYLEGMWQNINYLEPIRNVLFNKFKFKHELKKDDEEWARKIQNNNSVCIHIRRGDFLHSKFEICSEKYYEKAISLVKNELGENLSYYFFSDDIKYVKQKYQYLNKVYFVEHSSQNSDIDMHLMSLGKCNIIANSTFSFWAAFLNKRSELCIAPRFSTVDNIAKYTFSVPKSWKVLDPNSGELLDNKTDQKKVNL